MKDRSRTFTGKKNGPFIHFHIRFSLDLPSEFAQSEVISHMLMTQVDSFILFRKQKIDLACSMTVIILSSLNQPYWILKRSHSQKLELVEELTFWVKEKKEEKDKAWGTKEKKKKN